MLSIPIKFQAFIPLSLGKPLLSYFQNTPGFMLLSNKEEFIQKLKAKDGQGFTWLPEPGGAISGNFCSTDNVDIHNFHTEHTTRLGFNMEIDLEKIGKFRSTDKLFSHQKHGGWGGNNSQHSGQSHRVQAYIKRIPFLTDMPRPSNKDIYVGICDDGISTLRSEESPLEMAPIRNSRKSVYPSDVIETSIMKIGGSANYPFLKTFAPNIDFEVNVKLIKNLKSKVIDINISGWHNKFPAYELIVGQKILYNYNPAKYGYTGPTPFNLTQSTEFSAKSVILLNDAQVKLLKYAR